MSQHCLARDCDNERSEGSWFCQIHQTLAKIYHHNPPPRRPPRPIPHEDSKPVERTVEWITVIMFGWVVGFTLFLIGQELHLW